MQNKETESIKADASVEMVPPVVDKRLSALTGYKGGGAASRAFNTLELVSDHYGVGYVRIGKSSTVVRLDHPKIPAVLLQTAAANGVPLELREAREMVEYMKAAVLIAAEKQRVWLRFAKIKDGVEHDLGDAADTRVRITPGRVEICEGGTDTPFWRSSGMKALPRPAPTGNFDALDKFLSLPFEGRILLKGLISYLAAHPKDPANTLPILVVGGDPGTGKTTLCRRLQRLLDPSSFGVQTFPKSGRDMAISIQSSFLTVYDNVRHIRPDLADLLCVAATGGAVTTRKLYTNAELETLRLHGAIVLNGVHSLVEQVDLAQRCVVLHLLPLSETDRRSEQELDAQFEQELPGIYRGMIDLIAEILERLPQVSVSSPERLVDFVAWLGAIELIEGVPAGGYQQLFSRALSNAMLDSLLENPIAAAVLSFIGECERQHWEGTPRLLLDLLTDHVSRRAAWSRDWPDSPIALSKQLKSLQAGLRRHGVEITWSRGKERQIALQLTGGGHE